MRRLRCSRGHLSLGRPFRPFLNSLTFCPQIPALALPLSVLVKVPTATPRGTRVRREEAIVFCATGIGKKAESHEQCGDDGNRYGFCHLIVPASDRLVARWPKLRQHVYRDFPVI